ncbi:ABC transporter substrate-binding protein [Reyranella sp.]|uniref:ABC transporter substrate-binding protein n=1 Tax=Reyranella sp. TaxID=1929291 RepID=UPI00271C47D5|nr:ABC transporter substrate-binding protein [Reyranella sp.]MDO8973063.1 ABC transporter substrate-binding protein [Reyranella sp.]
MKRTLAAMVAGAILSSAGPVLAQGKVVKFVQNGNLTILDPIWTTAYVTRNHGYFVYDTLFASDENNVVKPQMVDKYEVSADKTVWTFTLRDGLEWHDGKPVTSEDCIASIKRWGARDSMGQKLMDFVKEFKEVNPKTFQMVLKEPYGLVLDSLGKPSSQVPFMMPKRVADTDPFKQIDSQIGSGPFIYVNAESKPGEKHVYAKNTKYKPRPEPPSMLAGGKVVKIDRLEWLAISDPSTAVNALIQGEIDLIEIPVPDLFPLLKADKNVELYGWNAQGSQIIMRFNHLHPPFNNLKARQAAMYAIAQEDFLRAQVGDPEIYRVCNAPLVCGSPYEKSYGNLLVKPDLEKARQLLKESGYDGTPIVMMHATDLLSSNQLPPVGKQALEKIGFKVDLQSMDWQTVVTRRAKKDPPAQGGWNIFYTTTVTVGTESPAGNSFTSGGCEKAWFGWPCDAEMEKLRASYAREVDPAKRKEIAMAVSDRVMDQATYIVLGQYKAFGAYRKDRISGWLPGPVPVMWNITKK